MTSVIPYFCCIILSCCIWNGWSEQHQGEIEIIRHDGRTKQTGYSGDSLIIGSTTRVKVALLFGGELIPNNCTRLKIADYQIEYETIVLKGRSRSSKVGQSAGEIDNNRVDPSEYFIHVKKEVWSCLPVEPEKKGEMEKQSLMYLRIVNEMLSFKEIYDIKHYAGVDVTLVNYFGNEICVKVEETKCLARRGEEKFKQVQCEPVITFNSPTNPEPVLTNFVKSYHVSKKLEHIDGEYKKDGFLQVGEEHIKIISYKGVSLKIGPILTTKKTKEVYKLDNRGKYHCYPKQGVSPLLFTPEVYQKIDIRPSTSSRYAKITQEYFSKLFTIVDRQVHECRFHMNTRRIYRVLNSVIGKTDIKHVINEVGILELYVISLPHGGKSIGFTTVDFFYVDTRERIAYDDVFYVIMSLPAPHSTWSNTKMRDPLPDIVHKLGDRKVFRTLINSEGFNIRVGSRTFKTIGRYKVVKCTKKTQNRYLDQFNTVLKLNVVEDDAFHTEVIDDDRIFIEYISQESWLCTNKKDKLEFYRIVNKLKLPVGSPVHEIESFDGVEILVEPLDDGTKSVVIVEVKYMDVQNNAVFYEGNMVFQNEEIFTSVEASQLPNAVSKNEIFSLINDIPMRKHNSKDPFVKDVNKNHEFNIITKGMVMDFVVQPPKEKEPSKQSLYICSLEKNNDRTLLPYFIIKSQNYKSQMIDLKNAEDSVTNSKYFENINNKVWTCKYKDYWFHRVVNKQSLKKQIYWTTAISKIRHTDMDKVWFEMTNEIEYVVKMEGVRHAKSESSDISKIQHYPNLNDTYLINSGGHLMLFEEKLRTGAWKSGTQELKQETNSKPIKSKIVENIIEMKETDYDLDAGRMHKVPFSRHREVNEDNPSLRIGSKWSIHEAKADLRCTADKIFSPEQPADDELEFLPKVVSIRGGAASAEDAFEKFFTCHSQLTWKCTSEAEREILIVMNFFKLLPGKLERVKDIFYHDGVTVISEDFGQKQILEMIEVKYLDSKTKEVMTFDSIFESKPGLQKMIRGKNPAIIDVEYNLNENEKYRSDISLKGAVLEVGQRYESNYGEQTGRNVRFLRIYCEEVESDAKKKLLTVSAFNPKVMIFEELENGPVKFHPVEMNNEAFHKYFLEQQIEIWLCWEIGTTNKFHRLVRRFIMKDVQVHGISHVYYYDGVTIYGKKIIQEIRYLSMDDKGEYHVMRFDGFVLRNEKIGSNSVLHHNSQGVNARGMIYFPLSRRVLHTTNMQEDEVTYEVQSHWDVEIRNDDNDFITCIKEDIPETDEFGDIEIYSNLVTEKLDEPKWNEIILLKELHFSIQEEDVWRCERNGKLMFKRYVNKFYKTDSTTVRVYYPAGVSVEIGKLPDDNKFLQITQVKLLGPDSKTLVKYVGKLKLVSEVLPGAENFLINYIFNRESRGLQTSDVPYWPLNIMRAFAINLIFSSTKSPLEMTAVKYNDDRDSLQTKMVNNKAERVFKIGIPWEEEITVSNGRQFSCILDKWNSNNIFQYKPRVVEYVDDSLYQLDDVSFHKVFKMTKIHVYICTNDQNEFLRLESVFEGRIPILAIRYGDGVTVKIIKNKQVEITETIYMNVGASKVLKFIGCPLKVSAPTRLAKAGKKIKRSLTKFGAAILPSHGSNC